LQTKFKLEKPDVLAICLPNIPEYPIACLGGIEAGLAVTTINPIYTPGECQIFCFLGTHDLVLNNFDKTP